MWKRSLGNKTPCLFRVRDILHQKFNDNKGESILAQIMTTKEMAKYLKLHSITICKLCKEGKIPGIQIGRVWRFDKEVIDEWIAKS
jgi:excisionase family DNA binding protein